MVQIHPGLEIIDLGLYLVKENIIIFSDFHLGYEEAMARSGVLLPRYQFKDTEERLKKIFEKIGIKLKAIIITGDLKHEFGTINRQEWRDVNSILNLFGEYTDKIILLKNEVKEKVIIMGHEHPAISVSDGITTERVKSFIKGKWKDKIIIVLPSFNLVTEGTDVKSDRLLSPFLKDVSNFEAFAVPEFDKVLYFGKIKNLNSKQ